jgi:flagellin-like protein
MNKNKRGLSPVIATVLTIMLTVAAVAALSAFIVPFVRNSLQKSSECMNYGSYYTFEESGYNCYSGNLYAFSIKTSFNKEIANETDGFKLIMLDGSGATKQAEVKNGLSNSNIQVMGDSSGKLRTASPGGVLTYVYNATDTDKFVSAEVYPVLKSGRICADVKEIVKIVECSSDKVIS